MFGLFGQEVLVWQVRNGIQEMEDSMGKTRKGGGIGQKGAVMNESPGR
jgi:hypothetical protein